MRKVAAVGMSIAVGMFLDAWATLEVVCNLFVEVLYSGSMINLSRYLQPFVYVRRVSCVAVGVSEAAGVSYGCLGLPLTWNSTFCCRFGCGSHDKPKSHT